MQTRIESFVETLVNTAVAFLISMTVNAVVFPMYGFHATASQNAQIVLIFTVVSVVRNYIIRRFFNHRIVKRYKS